MKRLSSWIAAGSIAILATTGAAADPVEIPNNSFENPVIPPNYVPPTSWSKRGPAPFWGLHFNFAGLVAPDGTQQLFIGGPGDGAAYSDDLTAVLLPNTTYTLSGFIGWRNDDLTPLASQRTGTIQLVQSGSGAADTGTVLLAVTKDFDSMAGDTLGTYYFVSGSFTTDGSVVTDPLRVEVLTDIEDTAGIQTWFDLVQLDAQGPCVAPPANLVGWWPGDGTPDDILGANHGVVVGTVDYVAGQVDQAFSFPGFTGNYVNIPDSPDLDITGQLTIDAWIKPAAQDRRIVDKAPAGSSTTGYSLDTAGGVLRWIGAGAIISGSTPIPLDVYTHVAATYDGTVRLFVNGVEDGSGVPTQPLRTNDLPLRIGANSLGSGVFLGEIDEVEIFNRALAPAEIAAIVAAGSAGRCKQPGLSIATGIPAAALEPVDADIDLTTIGANVAATAFSIDYDETCLSFDDSDVDPVDDIPDSVTVNVPSDFSVTVHHNPFDVAGEIDVTVADVAPPVATLTDGSLITVTFTATCSPAGAPIIAPLAFSIEPEATFSNDLAVDIEGTTTDGSVEILAGLRGDCNSTGDLSAADLIAGALEIFDADGNFWLDVPGSTFAGNPVGCDANADTLIDAGDISCSILLIFGGNCGGGARFGLDGAFDAWTAPVLGLKDARRDWNGKLWIPVVLAAGSHGISSTAFSLDLADHGLAFDPADRDGDGVPDAVRFPQGRPDLVDVRYDGADRGGELDVTLAKFNGVLADGVLLEIAVRPRLGALSTSRQPARFADAPAASFGDLFGETVTGRTIDKAPVPSTTDDK